MGIFSRFNQVMKSNLNSMLDKAEDPDKLIAQTILDMKAEVKRAKRELVETLGTAKRLEKKQVELEAEVASWEDKAVLALRNGDEELAREALKRKMKSKQAVEDAKKQAASAHASTEEMKSTLENVERKIDELEAKKSSLAQGVRKAREGSPDGISPARGSSAFDELGRMGDRIDQLEAEVEAAGVLEDPKRSDLDAKFRELERGTRGGLVEDELSALKKKLEGK